jgi:hypothetical protein
MMTSGRRDRRIDFWRGLCLFGMVSWHLLTHPSFPRWLAFGVIQPFNFVAEGFVLLAGAAVGLRIAQHRSVPSTLLRRAGAVLIVHYALVCFVILLAAGERNLGLAAQLSAMPSSLWSVLNLSFQPYLADVLSVFVFLFAAAPVFQLVYDRFGALGLVSMSAVIFTTASAYPLNAAGAFDFNSWQLVFVAGILFGANYERLLTALKTTSTRSLIVLVLLFAAACFVRVFIAGPDGTRLPGWRAYLTFSRKPLTVARLLYIGLEMAVIALFTVRWWDTISKSSIVERIVALGRHSLPVFACSVALDYLLKAVCTELRLSFPMNLLAWLVELIVLFVLADVLDGRMASRRRLNVAASTLATN